MKRVILVICCILLASLTYGQDFLKGKDLSTIKASQISDAELVQISNELKANQMTIEQAEPLALSKGMSATEFTLLKTRIQSLPAIATEAKVDTKQVPTVIVEKPTEEPLEKKGLAVFGSELFTTKSLSFEPNQNMPAPPNYVLGPGDKLDVNVYGVQQFTYNGTISKNGTINIPNVGEVFLSGMHFEAAKNKLQGQISKIYTTLAGSGSKLSVSVSNYRTIMVTVIGARQSGNYRLSSMSTVYNALHVAGGPDDIGSYRKIELIRNNKVIKTIDLYRFLTKGDQSDNISLVDNDMIRIPSYDMRITLDGEIKRPGIFEVLAGEELEKVIGYAAGFTENAYKGRILVKQKTNKELKVNDLNEKNYSTYLPQSGDYITIDKILNRYENRVQIKGAVYRPGEYSLPETGVMTIKDLLQKADGVKENVFLSKASLIRQKEDLTKEYLSFDLQAAINGDTNANIILKKEDVIMVFYNQELLDSHKVSIEGEVRKPGFFVYVKGMTLYDLLLESEYFTEIASSEITIFRTKIDKKYNANDKEKIESFDLSIDPKNAEEASTFLLEPEDKVVVRRIATFETPQMVYLKGAFLYPGSYAIEKKEARVLDFVNRAGGLREEADTNGIKVVRNDLNIPIDWKGVLENPKDSRNIILFPGDFIEVPTKSYTVTVIGGVMFSTEVPYKKGKNIKYYISNSGGITDKGWKRKVYVVHTNGSASTIGSFLGIRSYPKVLPGSKIIVPEKPERAKTSTTEIVGIASVLTSLAGVLLAVFR